MIIGTEVILSSFGKRRHKSYPGDVIYKIEDYYQVPGTDKFPLIRYTCSCEDKPNPKSKKGLYYMLNSEVRNYTMDGICLVNLSNFNFLNYPTAIDNLSVEEFVSKITDCLNLVKNAEIKPFLEEFRKLTSYLDTFVQNRLKEKTSFKESTKYFLIQGLITALKARIKEYDDLDSYETFYIDDMAHKIVRCLYISILNGLSESDLLTYLKEDNSKINYNVFKKALKKLLNQEFIEVWVNQDDHKEKFRINKKLNKYLEEKKF